VTSVNKQALDTRHKLWYLRWYQPHTAYEWPQLTTANHQKHFTTSRLTRQRTNNNSVMSSSRRKNTSLRVCTSLSERSAVYTHDQLRSIVHTHNVKL